MKPPHSLYGSRNATDTALGELSAALGAGRLVELLRGNGLTQKTVDELLRPESVATLQSILTKHLFPTSAARDGASGHESGRPPREGGRLLVFKARKPAT